MPLHGLPTPPATDFSLVLVYVCHSVAHLGCLTGKGPRASGQAVRLSLSAVTLHALIFATRRRSTGVARPGHEVS